MLSKDTIKKEKPHHRTDEDPCNSYIVSEKGLIAINP